jgi:NAD(P)-dependent dehydrogenase (short-subunit alcohol dehydrogenase family)
MKLLEGKTALVTGAGRGIGRGIAIALAKAGANIVVNDFGVALDGQNEADTPAGNVVAEIEAMGGHAVINRGSVAEFTDAADMVKQALERAPSERHLSADIYVEATLGARWPCVKKGGGV